jgi:hypothetical protein
VTSVTSLMECNQRTLGPRRANHGYHNRRPSPFSVL